jgi:hypothetical protein
MGPQSKICLGAGLGQNAGREDAQMVCREIITCPLVQQLRGDFQLSRIIYCETSSAPCALRPLVAHGRPVPVTLLPNGNHRSLPPA